MKHQLVNEFAVVPAKDAFHTHFGLFSKNDNYGPTVSGQDGAEHSDPSTEEMLWRAPGVTAWVSGSWECWGPADQATDGGQSLHIMVLTYDMPREELLRDFHEALKASVNLNDVRVGDRAYITMNDHSEILKCVTFDDGMPQLFRPSPTRRALWMGPIPRARLND